MGGRTISGEQSFQGFNIVELVKGRKKSLISLVGAGIAYFVSSDATVSFFAGLIVETGIGILTFYLKRVELK